jgi:hypothetical protein
VSYDIQMPHVMSIALAINFQVFLNSGGQLTYFVVWAGGAA